MKTDPQLSETGELSPEDLEAIFKVARRQAEAVETPTDDSVDWRALGYVVLAGSILVLVTLQLMG